MKARDPLPGNYTSCMVFLVVFRGPQAPRSCALRVEMPVVEQYLSIWKKIPEDVDMVMPSGEERGREEKTDTDSREKFSKIWQYLCNSGSS